MQSTDLARAKILAYQLVLRPPAPLHHVVLTYLFNVVTVNKCADTHLYTFVIECMLPSLSLSLSIYIYIYMDLYHSKVSSHSPFCPLLFPHDISLLSFIVAPLSTPALWVFWAQKLSATLPQHSQVSPLLGLISPQSTPLHSKASRCLCTCKNICAFVV